jgi:6-phosphogluconate dehydrogenase
MEEKAQIFKNQAETDKANRAYYASLTPEERTAILIQMIDDYYGTEHRLERVPGAARIVRMSCQSCLD